MKKRPLLYFFIFTYAITWGLASLYFMFPEFLTRLLGELSMHNPLFIVAVWGPTISAIIVAGVSKGRSGILNVLKSYVPRRANFLWYLGVIAVIPGIGVLINFLTHTEIKVLSLGSGEIWSLLFVLIITGPLGEEPGWRGFALPRLLKRYSPIWASLILGIIWGVWHFPSFYSPDLPQAGMQIPLFLLTALGLSITATWVFINTGQNVFLTILLHLSVNATAMLVGLELLYMTIMQLLITACILIVFGWKLSIKDLSKST